MDQSDPAVQAKMLQALDEVLDADYVSRALSPTTNWLVAFQDFVAQRQPADFTADAFVAQAAFYDNLEVFLTQQVCPLSAPVDCMCRVIWGSEGQKTVVGMSPAMSTENFVADERVFQISVA
jgi:hypothetical protein